MLSGPRRRKKEHAKAESSTLLNIRQAKFLDFKQKENSPRKNPGAVCEASADAELTKYGLYLRDDEAWP